MTHDDSRRNRQTEQEAVAQAAAVQEGLEEATLAAAGREAMDEATHGPGAVARSRDRARAGNWLG